VTLIVAGRCHSLQRYKEDWYNSGEDEGQHEHAHEQRSGTAHVEGAGWRIKIVQTGSLKQTVASSNKVAMNTEWHGTLNGVIHMT